MEIKDRRFDEDFEDGILAGQLDATVRSLTLACRAGGAAPPLGDDDDGNDDDDDDAGEDMGDKRTPPA